MQPSEIDFIKIQDHYCLEVSQCFYSLIALIYLEQDMNYAEMYPILKKVMSSNYMVSYPLKDYEMATMYENWNSQPYSRVHRLTFQLYE